MSDKENNEKEMTSVSNVILIIILILLVELVIGTIGYMYFNNLSILDGFRNAALVLPGVGEDVIAKHPAGKIWSSVYAMTTFFITIVVIGVLAGRISQESDLF